MREGLDGVTEPVRPGLSIEDLMKRASSPNLALAPPAALLTRVLSFSAVLRTSPSTLYRTAVTLSFASATLSTKSARSRAASRPRSVPRRRIGRGALQKAMCDGCAGRGTC